MSPDVARLLPAMTAVQAVVAMGSFALSVLAPQMGVQVQALGLIGSGLFAVGAVSSALSGWLIRRCGDLPLAALCTAGVMTAMACLALEAAGLGPAGWSLWPAVVLLGLAFGPETPASAAVLSRVTPAASRPWVFSIRQTGNQIGAMLGSFALPLLMLRHAAWPFVLVAVFGLFVTLWCLALVPRHGAQTATAAASREGGLRLLRASRPLQLLTLTTVVFMATQVCLNFFVISHAVRHWQLPVAQAAGWVVLMQGAGLAGRLFWGWAVQRVGMSPARLLGGLGCAIGATGLLLFLWPGVPPPVALAALFALLGFTASGWNGVLVAEVSCVVGAANAGAATGAVLLFGYGGLALAPLTFAWIGARWGTSVAYSLLLAATTCIGLLLLSRTSQVSERPSASNASDA